MTHYLCFPDACTGLAALDAAGLLSTDEDSSMQPITASHTHALDVIGPITLGGSYDSETGAEITPPTLLEGWHVNFIGTLPTDWQQYVVTPEHPARVFA